MKTILFATAAAIGLSGCIQPVEPLECYSAAWWSATNAELARSEEIIGTSKYGTPILNDHDFIAIPCVMPSGAVGTPPSGPQVTPEPPLPPVDPEPPIEPPMPPVPDREKCNSGRGNGSEGSPDCDPGNSGGHNHGGD